MRGVLRLAVAALLVWVVAAFAGVPQAVGLADRARQWGSDAGETLGRWAAGGRDPGPMVRTPATPQPSLPAPRRSQEPPTPFPRLPGLQGGRSSPPPAGTPDAVVAALDSVVQVVVRACGRGGAGSGFVVGPGRVMTNAHVVRGASAVGVRSRDGVQRSARVVLFDARTDVAVLEVAGLDARPLRPAGEATRGESAWVAGHPRGGPLRVVTATVLGTVTARGADQETYVLRTVVRPGNSGGPLLDADGDVLGVVFATAADGDPEGYARTWRAVEQEAADGVAATRTADVGSCSS